MVDFLPTHPGEILLTEFLQPLGITQYRLAKEIDVPQMRVRDCPWSAFDHRRHRATAVAGSWPHRYVLDQHAGALRR